MEPAECPQFTDASNATPLPGDAVRAQVELLGTAKQFAKSKQLKLLLEFLVNEVLAGRATKLKEYSVAVGVFGRAPSFDPTLDNIVRVEARRLRAKLDDYYATAGWLDPIRIWIPKGSYVPQFAVMTLQPETWRGAMLNRYRVEGLLGEVPDGILFQAFDTLVNSPVSLWLSHVIDNPVVRRSVLEQARQAAGLVQFHLLPIREVGEVSERVFTAFSPIFGSLLSAHLDDGSLSLDQALTIMASLAKTLEHLHSAGFVIGSLEPHNIVLESREWALRPLLILAAADPWTAVDDIRRSPEQRDGKCPDARSDIWALGAALRRVTDQIPCAAPLKRVIERCLGDDPELRWQSAAQLGVALENLREEEPGVAKMHTKLWQATFSGLIALLVALVLLSSWLARSWTSAAPGALTKETARTPNVDSFKVWLQGHEATLDYINNRDIKSWQQSEQLLLRSLELDPVNVEALVDLGDLYLSSSFPPTADQAARMSSAEASYRRALALAPRDSRALSSFGNLLFLENQRRAGMELIERAISINKDEGGSHLQLATVYCGMGFWEAALVELDRAIHASPLMKQPFRIKSSLLSHLGRDSESVLALNELPFNSQDREFRLGYALLRAGKDDEASKVLNAGREKATGQIRGAFDLLLAVMDAQKGSFSSASRLFAQTSPGIRAEDQLLLLEAIAGNSDRFVADLPRHPLSNSYRWVVGEPRLKRFKNDPRFRAVVRDLFEQWCTDLMEIGPRLPAQPPRLPTPEEYFRTAGN